MAPISRDSHRFLQRRDESSDTTNPSNDRPPPSGANPGVVAGVLTCILIVLFLVLVVIIPYLKRRSQEQSQQQSIPTIHQPEQRRSFRPDRSFFGHRKGPRNLVLSNRMSQVQSPRRVSFAIPESPLRQQHPAPPPVTPRSAKVATPRSCIKPNTPRSALAATPVHTALLSPQPPLETIPQSPLTSHHSGQVQRSGSWDKGHEKENPFSSPLDKQVPSAMSEAHGDPSPLTAYINHLNTMPTPKTAPAYTSSHTIGQDRNLRSRGTASAAASPATEYKPESARLGVNGFSRHNVPHSMPTHNHSFAKEQANSSVGKLLQSRSKGTPSKENFSSPGSPESDYGDSPVIPFPEPHLAPKSGAAVGFSVPGSPLSPSDAVVVTPTPHRSAFPFNSPGSHTPWGKENH